MLCLYTTSSLSSPLQSQTARWQTPVTSSNQSPVIPFSMIQLLLLLHRFWMMATMLSGIPYCLRINHNEGRTRCMQSKAFQKSMKFIITGICHAVTFSMICLSAKIWSLHDLPGLNPACSCRKYVSMLFLNLLSNTLANTLPGTDSSVMPRQLLQSDRSPFLRPGHTGFRVLTASR